jgi:hypothetical protein
MLIERLDRSSLGEWQRRHEPGCLSPRSRSMSMPDRRRQCRAMPPGSQHRLPRTVGQDPSEEDHHHRRRRSPSIETGAGKPGPPAAREVRCIIHLLPISRWPPKTCHSAKPDGGLNVGRCVVVQSVLGPSVGGSYVLRLLQTSRPVSPGPT